MERETAGGEGQPAGERNEAPPARAAWGVALVMGLGYVGLYLCRRNLSVAIPMFQAEFGVSKQDVGAIASYATVAYMAGKFMSGPLVDRIGGRAGLLGSLAGVVLFGALGGLAPGLGALTLLHSLSRLSGAGAWNAIMKLTASWFPPGRLATAIAMLSLSYLVGGIAGTLFAQQVVRLGGDWRAVMALPSLALLLILGLCAVVVRRGPLEEVPASEEATAVRERLSLRAALPRLLARPDFQTICILSFTLTLVRDALTTWGVDYLLEAQHGEPSLALAALQSAGFDLAGAVPILLMGFTYDRLKPGARRWVIAGILAALAGVLALMTGIGRTHPGAGALLLALAGLLLYGPFSILGGVVAIESGGTALAGTASGVVDGIGYLAAILAGHAFGRILDTAGYPTALSLMAGLTLFAALAALRLRGQPPAAVAAE